MCITRYSRKRKSFDGQGEPWILTSVLAKSHEAGTHLSAAETRSKERRDRGCHGLSLFPHSSQREPGVGNIDLASKYWFNEGSWRQLEQLGLHRPLTERGASKMSPGYFFKMLSWCFQSSKAITALQSPGRAGEEEMSEKISLFLQKISGDMSRKQAGRLQVYVVPRWGSRAQRNQVPPKVTAECRQTDSWNDRASNRLVLRDLCALGACLSVFPSVKEYSSCAYLAL